MHLSLQPERNPGETRYPSEVFRRMHIGAATPLAEALTAIPLDLQIFFSSQPAPPSRQPFEGRAPAAEMPVAHRGWIFVPLAQLSKVHSLGDLR